MLFTVCAIKYGWFLLLVDLNVGAKYWVHLDEGDFHFWCIYFGCISLGCNLIWVHFTWVQFNMGAFHMEPKIRYPIFYPFYFYYWRIGVMSKIMLKKIYI